jgi:phosphoglycerate dehydrogenase-like enzyme
MRKIIIARSLDLSLINRINELVPDWEIIAGKDEGIWLKHLKDAEIIASWKKGMEEFCFKDDSKLKWVQTWSAGVNSLPLEELESRKIFLTSANGVHAYPISETIFALMLGLTRKIHSYVKNQQAKIWHHSHIGLEIHGKTIGIIGVGVIGKETAKIAKAFGMRVLGVRHSAKLTDYVDEMFTADQLNLVLPQCDYVVVTLPLTKETHHIFGRKQFTLMKSSAFFINIGRGEIVVEEDLIEALMKGEIAGAGLDVFAKEPLSEDSPFWEMDNIIVTPHTSGSTEHYNQRVVENIFIPNLQSYLLGETPKINLVNYTKGY